jgi:hypothetical protein
MLIMLSHSLHNSTWIQSWRQHGHSRTRSLLFLTTARSHPFLNKLMMAMDLLLENWLVQSHCNKFQTSKTLVFKVAIREKYHCIATGIIDELGVTKFPADFGAVRATHILPSTWIKLAETRIVGSLIAHLIKCSLSYIGSRTKHSLWIC